ncbi:MAG: hypothetical protein ABGX15_16755 [Paracoccaceae bacterium]
MARVADLDDVDGAVPQRGEPGPQGLERLARRAVYLAGGLVASEPRAERGAALEGPGKRRRAGVDRVREERRDAFEARRDLLKLPTSRAAN